MSVIGFGAAFEHSSAGLIVSAIYPGGPIHIANDHSRGNFVELQVCWQLAWLLSDETPYTIRAIIIFLELLPLTRNLGRIV